MSKRYKEPINNCSQAYPDVCEIRQAPRNSRRGSPSASQRKREYSDKLKDPRWQRRRLEVFQRDNWTCTICGDTETTLHAHHNQYKGDPWEVDAVHVVTLCEFCHSRVEEVADVAKAAAPGKRFTAKMLFDAATKALEACTSDKDWVFLMHLWVELKKIEGESTL